MAGHASTPPDGPGSSRRGRVTTSRDDITRIRGSFTCIISPLTRLPELVSASRELLSRLSNAVAATHERVTAHYGATMVSSAARAPVRLRVTPCALRHRHFG